MVQKSFLKLTKWCTRQSKWCVPLQTGLARTVKEAVRSAEIAERLEHFLSLHASPRGGSATGERAYCHSVIWKVLKLLPEALKFDHHQLALPPNCTSIVSILSGHTWCSAPCYTNVYVPHNLGICAISRLHNTCMCSISRLHKPRVRNLKIVSADSERYGRIMLCVDKQQKRSRSRSKFACRS